MQEHETVHELAFTRAETRDLMRAVPRQCDCSYDVFGELLKQCPDHQRLADSQELKRWLFARRLVRRWRVGEFETCPESVA